MRRLLHRRLPLPGAIAWRYMLGERSQMLSSTAAAALIATTVGVTAMVIAMALMTGYTENLQRKLIGLQGEILAAPPADGSPADDGALARARGLPGVAGVGRVAFGQGSLRGPGLPEGASVVLRGIDPGGEPDAAVASEEQAPRARLAPDEHGLAGVLLGAELHRQLAVEDGDVLRLVVLEIGPRRPRFRYRSVRVAGSFTTGFAEFDARWVLLDRGVLARARGGEGFDFMELRLEESADDDEVAAQLEETLGPGWRIYRWQALNRQLFAALELQEAVLFLVLGLIVVVSTFNVASTLVILVRERMRDIGVLGSLGLTPRQLWWTFTVYGLGLGAAGTLLGVTLGAGTAWLITELELVRFDPEVAAIYFIDSVPFTVELTDVAAIVAFALAATLLACSLPALRAARLAPSEALRDE